MIPSFVRQKPRRAIVGLLVVMGAGLLALLVISNNPLRAASPSEQPIAYSHTAHIEAGMTCLYCHSGAARGPVAGIPSVEACMGCHRVITTVDGEESEAIQALAGYAERREPIPWEAVTSLPDFVYFPHRPHVSSGVACETCHGDVGSMTTAEAVVDLNMGFCLDCHDDQNPEAVPHLIDCYTCHK